LRQGSAPRHDGVRPRSGTNQMKRCLQKTRLEITAGTAWFPGGVARGRRTALSRLGSRPRSLLLTPSLGHYCRPSRPFPVPPGPVHPLGGPCHNICSLSNPYLKKFPRSPYMAVPVDDQPPAATLREGTLSHKGFYDLLKLILTPHHHPLDFSGEQMLIRLQICDSWTKIRGFT
jgi:hypothetical protein